MKRHTFALLATLVVGGLTAGAVLAQEVKETKPAVPTNAPTVRPAMRDQADVLALRLGLTDEQKQKVRPVLAEQSQKFLELRKVPDLKPEDRRAKYTAIREEINAKLKPILTPEQYDKYTKPFQTRTNATVRPGNMVSPAAPAPAAPAK
jgi:Spy/CpxP family protein refolding chaperone